jgi:hypothetical protein
VVSLSLRRIFGIFEIVVLVLKILYGITTKLTRRRKPEQRQGTREAQAVADQVQRLVPMRVGV